MLLHLKLGVCFHKFSKEFELQLHFTSSLLVKVIHCERSFPLRFEHHTEYNEKIKSTYQIDSKQLIWSKKLHFSVIEFKNQNMHTHSTNQKKNMHTHSTN